VDHRGEEASLLADSVWDWDTVAERGPEEFAAEVGALDRRAGRRGGGAPGSPGAPGVPGGRGGPGAVGGGPPGGREPVAVGPGIGAPGVGVPVVDALSAVNAIRVSPIRAGLGAPSSLPRVAPGEPIPTYVEPPDLASAAEAGDVEADEPALPDEQRSRAAMAAQAPSEPIDAPPGAVLNVRFVREAGTERVVSAMQAFKSVLRDRPGATRVVVHVPAPGGEALPMELRGVAYDTELLAEVRRRVGDGVIDLQLG
jgi:hypothetical protein